MCRGPAGTTKPPSFFPTNDVRVSLDGTLRSRRKCTPCNNSTACNERRFHKVNTILDLPPHYARQVWFNFRRGIDRPVGSESRKSTTRR